jgi:very-short-patch-repair endonuclease
MRAQNRTVERELARIASAAHGVVTRDALLEAGVTRAEIESRVRSGALIREHLGVYRVGHRAPNREARYLAAVLACGHGAALSGVSAAHLLGLVDGAEPLPEVTTPVERRVSGVTTRRARGGLHPGDMTTVRGIPVTSAARTLVDLARLLDAEKLARACHEAGIRHGTTPRQVEAVLSRRPRSPGAGMLRAILRGDVRVTLSVLERRFLERLTAAGLPLPQTNRLAGGRRVDCRWPEQRLTVELDGYRYHGSRHAWEQDRRREREARARGDEFRRYTYGDVVEDPRQMLAELRALLARPGSSWQDERGTGQFER